MAYSMLCAYVADIVEAAPAGMMKDRSGNAPDGRSGIGVDADGVPSATCRLTDRKSVV